MATLRYPQVEIVARIGTAELVLQGWLDTGFEGGLIIPAHLRHEILAGYDEAPFQLADGHQLRVPAWGGEVEIEGRPFGCEVIALGKQTLVGLEVMSHFDVEFARGTQLRFRFPDGGAYFQDYV